jgi:hypothetical protein
MVAQAFSLRRPDSSGRSSELQSGSSKFCHFQESRD